MDSAKGISFMSAVVPALLITIALVLPLFAWQIEIFHREDVIKHEIAVNFASNKWAGFHSGDVDQCVLAARFDKSVPCAAP